MKIFKSLFNLHIAVTYLKFCVKQRGIRPILPLPLQDLILGVFSAVLKRHTLANFEVDFKLFLRNLYIILCLITAERARYGPSRMDNAG